MLLHEVRLQTRSTLNTKTADHLNMAAVKEQILSFNLISWAENIVKKMP
jgi:hypothetical protein